jgi:hypothetical protein
VTFARIRNIAPAGALAAAVVIMHGATACGSFGETTSQSDAGTSPEGGAAAGEGGGDAGDSGGLLPGCLPPTCETFETDGWRTLWKVNGSGQIGVTSGEATSGNRALEVLLSSNAPTFIQQSLGLAPIGKVTVSVNMLVVEGAAAGEIDFVEIVDGQSDASRGVHFVHAHADDTYVVESSATEPKPILEVAQQSLATYQRVVLELNLTEARFTATVGSGPPLAGSIDPAWKPKQLFVAVGAAFAQSVMSATPWRVRFDDLSVVTAP